MVGFNKRLNSITRGGMIFTYLKCGVQNVQKIHQSLLLVEDGEGYKNTQILWKGGPKIHLEMVLFDLRK